MKNDDSMSVSNIIFYSKRKFSVNRRKKKSDKSSRLFCDPAKTVVTVGSVFQNEDKS